MTETKPFYKKPLLWIIILVLIATISGGGIWYFQVKLHHDNATKEFNTAVESIEKKNSELDEFISKGQKLIDSNEQPYDENTKTELQVAIADTRENIIKIPSIPKKTEDILKTTKELNKPLDYSTEIANLQEKTLGLENSIKQLKQITSPTGDFVIQRLNEIEEIVDIQGATEDNDPNNQLNKQGGYTSASFFSTSLLNQANIYGDGLMDKGTDAGGCIEVFKTVEDAEKRNTYISAFDGQGALNPGSHKVVGTIVVRTSSKLKASQQTELETKIINKLIELQ